MKESEFWALVDRTRKASPANMAGQIRAMNAEWELLPARKCLEVFVWSRNLGRRAFTWDMLLAAKLLGGGALGGDSFADFRDWLVSRGSQDFNHVINCPDNLADLEFRCPFEPDFFWLPVAAFEQKKGRELRDSDTRNYTPLGRTLAGEPLELTFEVMKRRLPKLWARFGAELENPPTTFPMIGGECPPAPGHKKPAV